MSERIFLGSGALFAVSGVFARSLSSHLLLAQLQAAGKLDNYNLAADYLLIHGLALLAVVCLGRFFANQLIRLAGWALLLGTTLFCSTVLLKCFTSLGAIGRVTPLGGLIMMIGWLLLLIAAFRLSQHQSQ